MGTGAAHGPPMPVVGGAPATVDRDGFSSMLAVSGGSAGWQTMSAEVR